jgi:hypothetical protein
VQHERELHDLARLELQRAHAEPAARAVDLDADARDLHEHEHHERGDQQRAGVAAHEVELDARDDLHRDQPDGPIADVLDQVRGPVPLALEHRAGRGGRVDHDGAAGQQAEGGGQQQSVLERLLRSAHRTAIRHDGSDAFRAFRR